MDRIPVTRVFEEGLFGDASRCSGIILAGLKRGRSFPGPNAKGKFVRGLRCFRLQKVEQFTSIRRRMGPGSNGLGCGRNWKPRMTETQLASSNANMNWQTDAQAGRSSLENTNSHHLTQTGRCSSLSPAATTGFGGIHRFTYPCQHGAGPPFQLCGCQPAVGSGDLFDGGNWCEISIRTAGEAPRSPVLGAKTNG